MPSSAQNSTTSSYGKSSDFDPQVEETTNTEDRSVHIFGKNNISEKTEWQIFDHVHAVAFYFRDMITP